MKKILIILLCITMFACATRSVKRVDDSTAYDLSGRWNDTDSRLVSEEMIADSFTTVWLNEYVSETGKKPVLVVGIIRNKTSEHISTETFVKDIERAYVNSGKIKIVQAGSEREELRKERNSQTENMFETTVRWGKELGANFILQGVINSITDQIDKKKVIFYQIDLEITNIESSEKVWIGSKKIKKFVTN